MNRKRKNSGFSLSELMVVVAIMSILAGIAVPVIKTMLDSFELSSGIKSILNAAFSSARAMAMANQKYVGVRFQQDQQGNHYMIFIEHDYEATNLASGFRAIKGRKPIKLPNSVGIMDLKTGLSGNFSTYQKPDSMFKLVDAMTFSVVFSPAGKLVSREVQTRNYDGEPDSSANTDGSNDDVFNKRDVVAAGNSMFCQDDYYSHTGDVYEPATDLWYGPESSSKKFIIFDRKEYNKYAVDECWDNYLKDLPAVYINGYSGQIILE
jgi:prepilin-type N-terminal cleavage/methylation domain-containing protein